MAASGVLSPETTLDMPAPAATLVDAIAIGRRHFGLDAEARPLASERDKNFHLQTSNRRAFVLKIVNAAEREDVGAFQSAALRHIERRDPALPVPRVCSTLTGDSAAVVRLENGTDHLARLLSYLPGRPMQQTEPSCAQAAALGRCLAGVGLALRDFQHSAAAHTLLWDLKHAPKLRAVLPHVADKRHRTLASRVLDRYEGVVLLRAAAFRTQAVHNDGNPNNVLVDPDHPARVTGLVDFGDLVETALIHDVAIAAAYQVEGDDPLARAAALTAGYHAVSPLRPEEVDSLFDLISLRHVMTVTIAAWRTSLYPENRAYLLRHQPRAAAALESLDRIGPAEGRRRLREACGLERP